MTIKKRITELEKKVKVNGDDRTEEELEALRAEIEKYERIVADRFKKMGGGR